MTLTQDELKRLLDYNSETGVFVWREGRRNPVKQGAIAGTVDKAHGYRRIKVNGKRYRAHRLAWLYVYGYFPEGDMDHKNRNRDDNRIENLREASRSQNLANRLPPRADTPKGASRQKGSKKWRAVIKLSGRRKHLGCFASAAEAGAAYSAAAAKHYGEFARISANEDGPESGVA